MSRVSRRDFGKNLSRGALGALAAASVPPPASPQGEVSTAQSSPKRMTTVLRELIKGPGFVDAPSIYDPLTAKIAEMVGFRCVTMPGSARGIATCRIESTLSLDEVAATTQSITAVIGIPLLVDAGGGFGEPAHVFHTVRALEHAGAAGVYIEDQISPKRFHYYMDGKLDVISAQAMVEKIRYAVQARRDHDFVIGACTGAISTHGFAEGVRRANLYLATGADYALIFPRDLGETRQIPKEVRGPLNFVNAEQGLPGRPNFTAQELGAMGWTPRCPACSPWATPAPARRNVSQPPAAKDRRSSRSSMLTSQSLETSTNPPTQSLRRPRHRTRRHDRHDANRAIRHSRSGLDP